ncbi:RNA polymerase sigma factor SigJ [Phytomonospora endophytica]|uniref:RNA polymerase sigma-70 factor (ECF subfamily) n=1 Tax=Phytomonospora endophytica TaxID=714109 RepID=A0A841FDT4_9ACTN|nr:RNA polymerase sigma factor SigJ [Phytomonospora endophytica]MBB6034436.1 RNA polymerase sigma-70 factor (ECF subfamily) [Phytomonospora endophytica]GIG66830.1 RNA polymerase sigma24 factor [Phytomonospora endophytica]
MINGVFEEHRPMLLGLAYRLLGSMWDAEDVVQDAFVKWSGADRSAVREPRAFLATMVSRLALDQLRSARRTREAYVGPWLPEPVASDAFGPLDTAELRDTLSYATLHLMERLSPPERAVFVLREAFDFPYETIAGIVGATEANCRQMHHRAAARLDGGRDRFGPSNEEHARLLSTFMAAAERGDLDTLTAMLGADVEAWNDGGGRVRAALRPIVGRVNVARLITGLFGKVAFTGLRLVEANGGTAIRAEADGMDQVIFLEFGEGKVLRINAVLNPGKLTRVES